MGATAAVIGPWIGIAGGAAAVGSVFAGMDSARRARHTASDIATQENAAISSALANKQPVMPTPDDAAVQAAKQASIAEQVARRGRASTILSEGTTQKLGD